MWMIHLMVYLEWLLSNAFIEVKNSWYDDCDKIMEAHQSCIAACWLVKGLFHFDDRCHKITNHCHKITNYCHKITDNIFVLILPSFDSKSVRYVSNFRTFIECFSESFTLPFHFSIRFPAFCDHFVCLFVSFLSAFVAFLPTFLPV